MPEESTLRRGENLCATAGRGDAEHDATRDS